MFVRIATYSGDVDAVIRGIEAACGYLKDSEGFSGAYFGVNRSRGKALSVTLWETEDALDASAIQAHQLRTWATEPIGARTESVMEYEVTTVLEGAGVGAG